MTIFSDVDNEFDDWTLTKEQRDELRAWRKLIMAEAEHLAKKVIKQPVNTNTDGISETAEKSNMQDDKKLPDKLRHNSDNDNGDWDNSNWADNW